MIFSDHAKELGSTVPTTPMIFLKPTSSYISSPGPIQLPKNTVVHHESNIIISTFFILKVELGVIIGNGGKDIQKENAMRHVSGKNLFKFH